jgi:ankyrin repeat protein
MFKGERATNWFCLGCLILAMLFVSTLPALGQWLEEAERLNAQVVQLYRQELLSKDAEVNAKEKEGWTALISASQNGHREIVQELLSRGAEVNAQDNVGKTALTWASEKGHQEVKELLIKAGAK